MEVVRYIVTSIFALCGLFMIVVIMLQESKGAGLGSLGGMSSTDTYWEKNKFRSREGKLAKWTRIAAIVFFVAALFLNINF